jgi:hypothetical protein
MYSIYGIWLLSRVITCSDFEPLSIQISLFMVINTWGIIKCIVFVLVSNVGCLWLWIVYSWLSLRFALAFIKTVREIKIIFHPFGSLAGFSARAIIVWQENVNGVTCICFLGFIRYNTTFIKQPNNRSILRNYYMTFSILSLILVRDSHIKPDSEGWYQGSYGKFHVIIFLSHKMKNKNVWHNRSLLLFVHDVFPTLIYNFDLEVKQCEKQNIPHCQSCLCSTCKYFCFESSFKNISSNVDLYNDVRNCL